jgi:hypothetical protein
MDLKQMATDIVAKLEHGDEEHRKWLRENAIPLIVNALESVRNGTVEDQYVNVLLRDSP